MFKKVTLIIASLSLFFVTLLAPAALFAVNVTQTACNGITDSTVCKEAESGQTNNPLFGPEGILTRAISILSIAVGVIAVIVLFVAGIRFVTSQGDSQKVNNARSTIIYAVVGVAVAALAQALVSLVLNKL
jgi:Type IV secretion system pilin